MKTKGIKTFLTLDLFSKQVTEFPGPQWMAKLATVSHRHSPPPCENSQGEGEKRPSPGVFALPRIYVCFAGRVISGCFFNLLKKKKRRPLNVSLSNKRELNS